MQFVQFHFHCLTKKYSKEDFTEPYDITHISRVARCQIHSRNPQGQGTSLSPVRFILSTYHMILQQQRKASRMSRAGEGLLRGPFSPRGTSTFACQNSPVILICLPQSTSHGVRFPLAICNLWTSQHFSGAQKVKSRNEFYS